MEGLELAVLKPVIRRSESYPFVMLSDIEYVPDLFNFAWSMRLEIPAIQIKPSCAILVVENDQMCLLVTQEEFDRSPSLRRVALELHQILFLQHSCEFQEMPKIILPVLWERFDGLLKLGYVGHSFGRLPAFAHPGFLLSVTRGDKIVLGFR